MYVCWRRKGGDGERKRDFFESGLVGVITRKH